MPELLAICDLAGLDPSAKAPAASCLSVSLRAPTASREYLDSLNIAANKLVSSGGQNSACHLSGLESKKSMCSTYLQLIFQGLDDTVLFVHCVIKYANT